MVLEAQPLVANRDRTHQERQIEVEMAGPKVATVVAEFRRNAAPMGDNCGEMNLRASQLGSLRVYPREDVGNRRVVPVVYDLKRKLIIAKALGVPAEPFPLVSIQFFVIAASFE